jgi:hypothetical protein
MRQQSKERLARGIESLAKKIAQDPDARLSKLERKIYLTSVGNKYQPELERLSKTFLLEGGWEHKLSIDYVEQGVLGILLELNHPNGAVETLALVEKLSGSFDGYNEQRTIYLPVSGVEMTDVEEVRFGDVVLKKMTEAQKEELAKDFETEEDRSKFFDRVRVVPFVEMTVSAEPIKA